MFRFAIVRQAKNACAVVSMNLTDAPTVMVESRLLVLSQQENDGEEENEKTTKDEYIYSVGYF
tara:strand:+ start:148 stop:336 length:189 start_codon:yes stop_codon:yes gene_type:complete